MAIAESVWSPKEKKNWNYFFGKVEKQFNRFDEAEIKYAPSAYDPSFAAIRNADGTLKITLTNEVEGLDTYYSFDNSFPDRFYPKYSEPIDAPKDATTLRVITYRGKKPIGRMVTMPLADLNSRIK
jgi:hexosaminidase